MTTKIEDQVESRVERRLREVAGIEALLRRKAERCATRAQGEGAREHHAELRGGARAYEDAACMLRVILGIPEP